MEAYISFLRSYMEWQMNRLQSKPVDSKQLFCVKSKISYDCDKWMQMVLRYCNANTNITDNASLMSFLKFDTFRAAYRRMMQQEIVPQPTKEICLQWHNAQADDERYKYFSSWLQYGLFAALLMLLLFSIMRYVIKKIPRCIKRQHIANDVHDLLLAKQNKVASEDENAEMQNSNDCKMRCTKTVQTDYILKIVKYDADTNKNNEYESVYSETVRKQTELSKKDAINGEVQFDETTEVIEANRSFKRTTNAANDDQHSWSSLESQAHLIIASGNEHAGAPQIDYTMVMTDNAVENNAFQHKILTYKSTINAERVFTPDEAKVWNNEMRMHYSNDNFRSGEDSDESNELNYEDGSNVTADSVASTGSADSLNTDIDASNLA